MEKNPILREIAEYCAAANISPSTLGVRVLGNSRFMDRLERKLEKLSEDESALRQYMRDNPVSRKPAPATGD